MIISRTPFRISFFGGGTDYPAWYTKHGGAVLATTIDKYCYITCRYLPPFFDHNYSIIYSKTERCKTLEEIEHPAVREVLKYLKIDRGVEIHHDADLPARSGIGSSSSFTVGLLHALHALQGKLVNPAKLTYQAVNMESEILKETVGMQDQVMAAYGGFNKIDFRQSGAYLVRPMTLPESRLKELQDHLMLFYTGISRTASDVAETYNLDERPEMFRMTELVMEAVSLLNSERDICHFGDLLHTGWQLKRNLSERVSNTVINATYESARMAGAIGGKIIGAGGGGFMLLFVPPANQPAVKERLSNLLHVPFTFESSGSQIIFYQGGADVASM